MSTCIDNPRLGRIGCGATYSGELQHAVAVVPWSRHPDGRAHVTASLSVIEKCWAKGGGQMADPATLGYEQDSTGRWRQPMTDEQRTHLAEIRQERVSAVDLVMNDYADATDCPICPQLATDRDDALRDATTAQDERDLWDDIATALYTRSDAVFSVDDPAARAYRAARNNDTDAARGWLIP